MSGVLVNFNGYAPPPRFDDLPWTQITIEESALETGPWISVEVITIEDLDADPSDPAQRSFSTENGSYGPGQGWYRISWRDADGNLIVTPPIFYGGTTEILATLDDINANLDNVVISANPSNSRLVQISVARVIKAYLTRVIDPTVLVTWVSPETTPNIIREIAAKLIAAQVYFNHIGKSSALIPTDHFAQNLYKQAMDLLNQIVAGTITMPGVATDAVENLTIEDFWPNSAKDRMFTVGQNF